MRSTSDRIRHALSFEIIGLVIVMPLGALAFQLPMNHMGVIAVGSSLVATCWTYLYNLLFDRAMQRAVGHTRKSVGLRILHAVAFEAGLLVVLMPLIAWYLGIGLIEALILDGALALFYLLYAFVFNLAYDRLFPLPEWTAGKTAAKAAT